MPLTHIVKSNFYTDLFEEHAIPSVYKKLKLNFKNEDTYTPKTKDLPKSKIYSFQLVPNYIQVKIDEKFVCTEVFQKKGYAIDLEQYNTVEDYIRAELKTSSRKNFNRIKNKLESLYNIEHSVFFGDISNDQYHTLMKALRSMLEKRFKERNGNNPVLENWPYYESNTIKLIRDKKASLFVVFSDNEPIALTLNYHHKKVIYSAIASYNIDFYKYSLGSVIIYKLIEWSALNQYKLVDLGYGNFSHKQLWCNTTYNFNNHIIYSNRVFGKLYAFFVKFKHRLIDYLISKNVNVLFNNLKKRFKGSNNNDEFEPINFNVSKINHLSGTDIKELNTINFRDTEYLYLRKPINDFIYSNNNHIDSISAFKDIKLENTIYIRGGKSSIKLTYTKN